MKKFLLGAVGTLAMVGSASAADLAARPYTKAPQMVAVAMYDWSGFYIGLNGGGGSSRKCWDINNNGAPIVPAFREGCHDATGGTVGGQVGYRWQSAAWVFGLEAQGNWADFRGNNISLFGAPGAFGNRSKIDAFGLFTGQLGYSWSNFLLYVKGGAAVTSDKYQGFVNVVPLPGFLAGTVFDRASETRWGGVIGVGGEYSFTQNWSFGLEYDHMFMGSRNNNFTFTGAVPNTPAGTFSRTDNIRQDVDIFTARVNYRFGGPVVARY